MAHAVNVAENIDYLEVYPGEEWEQQGPEPHAVESLLKNKVRHELKRMLETALELELDEQIQALRYERGAVDRRDYRDGYRDRERSSTLGSVELRVPLARQALAFVVFEWYR